MPSRASSSARSFSSWPAWPRTQCQRTSWRARAASSCCHRSAFLTGALAAVRQPLAFQPWIHSLMPFLTYSESVCRSTCEGCFRASSASMAAVQLHAVVGGGSLAALDLLAMRAGDQDRAPAARPRVTGAGAVGVDDHGGLVRHQAGPSRPYSLAERMLRWNLSRRRYSLRVLAAHQRIARRVQPVIGARQQEAQGGAARQQRQRLALGAPELAHALVALEQGVALGDVEGVVGLEAPGVERDGDVVDERIVAGEVEIDQSRQLLAEEEHVVGEQVGVDDALRQVGRPVRLEMRQLLVDGRGAGRARSPWRGAGTACRGGASRRAPVHSPGAA